MHIRFKRKSALSAAQGLSSKIETIQLHESMESFLDVEDEDILTYVDNLLRTCNEIDPLQPFSLMSRDEALHAISMLLGRSRMGESHRKTARALRTLLESKLEGAGQPQ